MDEMITKLSDAKPYELPNAVSKAIRVVSSPQFFLRIAERADQAADDSVEKEKLSALASNLVSTLEAVVSTAEDRMDRGALDVERVLKAAAEPESGEFLVPLSDERVEAMRVEVEGMESGSLDEGFLVTVDGWMNKSMQDGMDGMVGILQKVLQMYAAVEIGRARERLQAEVGAAVTGGDVEEVEKALAEKEKKPAAVLFERLLEMDTEYWDGQLKNALEGDGETDVSKSALMGEVQRTIEGVVLGLENGSMAQRVQAEFLRELVSRIEKYD